MQHEDANSLLVGPIWFVNHSTEPNAMLFHIIDHSTGEPLPAFVVQTKNKPIKSGDEITVSYGDNYWSSEIPSGKPIKVLKEAVAQESSSRKGRPARRPKKKIQSD
ncbi:hypothetical protein FRB95_010441 [Tulasnella sp. JGI-2019a]|nr:hypothetical protein FRB95_010441 [Tulasnella sp. JGI-2019a]